jgi:hypothetical protein
MEARFAASEQRTDARLVGVERRIDSLEDKVSRQFVWTVGVQVTTFVAIVAALLYAGAAVFVLALCRASSHEPGLTSTEPPRRVHTRVRGRLGSSARRLAPR